MALFAHLLRPIFQVTCLGYQPCRVHEIKLAATKMLRRSAYRCPKCSGRLKRMRPEPSLETLFAAFAADIGFQFVWLILAGAIAPVTYRLFGEVAALVILFAAAFATDHATARYRCKDCGQQMNRKERVAGPSAANLSYMDSPPKARVLID